MSEQSKRRSFGKRGRPARDSLQGNNGVPIIELVSLMCDLQKVIERVAPKRSDTFSFGFW